MTETTAAPGQSLFQAHRSTLEDLPPSAKLVAKALDHEAGLSQAQIAEETLLPDRTVRYALNRLEDADVVETTHDLEDARRHLYALTSPE